MAASNLSLKPRRTAAPASIFVAAALWLAGGAAGAAEPAQPLALHPDNPRYFTWRGEPTVIVGSGEHYGAVLNLDFDYERYFEALAADGLNHTRTFSGTYREIPSSFGITDNTLAPKPLRYIAPWARSDEPGYFDGGNKFDLNRWDEAYFQRLRRFMAEAQRRGVVVEMNLFCTMYNEELWRACPMNAASNVNGVGQCGLKEVFTLEHDDLTAVQLAFTRKIVAELRDFDNLYYEVCNEPYFNNVTMPWQRKIAETIAETEKDFPHRHLISMNIANGRAKVEDPHPAVSIFNFHYCVPPDVVALNAHLDKVIGENETGFRGRDDLLYRTEGWDMLMAGGALYSNLDYSFTPPHPAGDFLEYKSPGGGSPALRKQLGILKRFFSELDFVRMKPDNSVLAEPPADLAAWSLVEPGRAVAVYLHVPLPEKPKDLAALRRKDIRTTVKLDLPGGAYRAEWVNTKTGAIDRAETLAHAGGPLPIASPPFDDDIALRVRRQ
jgi:hypothetical protein